MTENQRHRIGILGCGAISEHWHLPALKKLGIKPALLVDRDLKRAQRLAKEFGAAAVADTIRPEHVDTLSAAIVATPPLAHGPLCIPLLSKGKHVFVEKPMTIAVDEARAVVAAAEAGRAKLGVSYVHRFSHVRQWAHALIASGTLGQIKRFDIREGYLYNWDIKTDAMWRRDQTGGGVLIDAGTHVFDYVGWLLGDAASVDYRDDSYGGVEAECLVNLTMKSGAVGTVELSRTRTLRNTAIFEGTDGHVEFTLSNENRVVNASPNAFAFAANGVTPATMPPQIVMSDLFKRQLALWLEAIESGHETPVSGLDGLRAVELVARCYAVRQPWDLPWMQPDHPHAVRETAHA
jgi:predicted dehydrogenase